jgi:hypothetical protein
MVPLVGVMETRPRTIKLVTTQCSRVQVDKGARGDFYCGWTGARLLVRARERMLAQSALSTARRDKPAAAMT